MSIFGGMCAPLPERVSREPAAVWRPGGPIAMANWMPEGFVGKTFRRTRRYVPPPQGIPAPVLWSVENVVKERLGGYASKTETARRAITFDYPLPPRQGVQFFREYFGPTQMAFSKLDAAGQSPLAADLKKLCSDPNKSKFGPTLLPPTYPQLPPPLPCPHR